MAMLQSKKSRIQDAWMAGNHVEAMRIAKDSSYGGSLLPSIQRGWSAMQNPSFYRQLGRDPQQLVVDGLDAVADVYGLSKMIHDHN
jgi:hypothetical protein